jgi:hypothetical protein
VLTCAGRKAYKGCVVRLTAMHSAAKTWLPRAALLLILSACSSGQPQGHPLNSGRVPQGARVYDQCSLKGQMACSLMSGVSGDTAAERRSACIAFRAPNWTLVESCGSLPAAHP